MCPKRKPDPSGSKDSGDPRPRKKKGKEKAKDVTSNIPANFFGNEEYEDFQAPVGSHPPLPTIPREQRDIEEETRLFLQMRPATESGESSSSVTVRPTLALLALLLLLLSKKKIFKNLLLFDLVLLAQHPQLLLLYRLLLSLQFEKVVSPTPSTPTESSSAPVHLSEKVKMKQARSTAKRMARQEPFTSESKRKPRVATEKNEVLGPRAGRTKFVIKTKLEAMLRAANFNQDQKTGFITEVRRVVRHFSDVTYAASLFLNWFYLRFLRNGEAVPKLTHKKLYNFAALFVGQGKHADTDIREAFLQFSNDMGEDFNRKQQFPNIQYSTLITIVMRSFETLIENHVGANFKTKTLSYLFKRLSDTNEFPDVPFRTGVKRDLAERIYNAVSTNQEMIYPANLEVADTHKTSTNNLIDECRQRLLGLNLTEADYYAKPHLYLPWLYYQVIIREPVPQTRAKKGFVHRQLGEIVDFRRLPRRFRSTLENHVRDSINMEQPTIQQHVNHSFLENTRRSSRAADPVQRQRHNDILPQEKAAIDDFVARTKSSVSRNEFRPKQFTDPHGARLFNILPIYSLQQRYVQINLTGISRIIRQSRIRPSVTANEDMKDVCWSLFNMGHIGFRSRNGLDRKALSNKSFTGAIRTDGIALEFICERPSHAAETDLNTATVLGLDPGVHDVFVACDGVGTGTGQSRQRHRIRKTSTSEYYQLSGFKSAAIKRAKHDRANVDARHLIYNIPSTRTCNWDQFNEAL
ncbi:MAG: hypothetical protein EXX96DRAFT_610687 [Benjaminiella poitrasii]|nr:MAG: hypothetical protein EXX96DRAFT_610687 [Benjaminiella poitrasii]